MFVFLQGGRAFALKTAHLKDPELRNLTADLPLRTIEAKAPSTTEGVTRELFKNSGNGLHLITRSFAAIGRDIDQLLFI